MQCAAGIEQRLSAFREAIHRGEDLGGRVPLERGALPPNSLSKKLPYKVAYLLKNGIIEAEKDRR